MAKSPTSRARRSRGIPAHAASATPTPAPAPETAPITARAATQDELAALARAQEGLASAEGFWKAAGRFSKLR